MIKSKRMIIHWQAKEVFEMELLKGESNPTFHNHEKKKKKAKKQNKVSLQLEPWLIGEYVRK